MKKLILTALVSLGIVAGAFAQTVFVEGADQFVGYDGDCRIYWRANYGYYEVCNNQPPVYLSWDVDQTTHWNHPAHHWFWQGHKNWRRESGARPQPGMRHGH